MNTAQPDLPDQLVALMRSGDKDALAKVFSHYRQRLKRIIQFRLDYRIAPRVSESDVLQETYLAAASRLNHYANHDEMSPFLWLRLLVGQQLIDVHRQHLKAEKRDARKERPIHLSGPSPHTSVAIAAQLVGTVTAASEIVARAEAIDKLEATLNEMEPLDREVIALRHFEELSNVETAKVLEISTSAASKRYLRAMARLAELIQSIDKTTE